MKKPFTTEIQFVIDEGERKTYMRRDGKLATKRQIEAYEAAIERGDLVSEPCQMTVTHEWHMDEEQTKQFLRASGSGWIVDQLEKK